TYDGIRPYDVTLFTVPFTWWRGARSRRNHSARGCGGSADSAACLAAPFLRNSYCGWLRGVEDMTYRAAAPFHAEGSCHRRWGCPPMSIRSQAWTLDGGLTRVGTLAEIHRARYLLECRLFEALSL